MLGGRLEADPGDGHRRGFLDAQVNPVVRVFEVGGDGEAGIGASTRQGQEHHDQAWASKLTRSENTLVLRLMSTIGASHPAWAHAGTPHTDPQLAYNPDVGFVNLGH